MTGLLHITTPGVHTRYGGDAVWIEPVQGGGGSTLGLSGVGFVEHGVPRAVGFLTALTGALSVIKNVALPNVTAYVAEMPEVIGCLVCGGRHAAEILWSHDVPSVIPPWAPPLPLWPVEASAAIDMAARAGGSEYLLAAIDRYRRALLALTPDNTVSSAFEVWSTAETIGRWLYELAKGSATAGNKSANRRWALQELGVPVSTAEDKVPYEVAKRQVLLNADHEALYLVRNGWGHGFRSLAALQEGLDPVLVDAMRDLRTFLLFNASQIAYYSNVYVNPNNMTAARVVHRWRVPGSAIAARSSSVGASVLESAQPTLHLLQAASGSFWSVDPGFVEPPNWERTGGGVFVSSPARRTRT